MSQGALSPGRRKPANSMKPAARVASAAGPIRNESAQPNRNPQSGPQASSEIREETARVGKRRAELGEAEHPAECDDGAGQPRDEDEIDRSGHPGHRSGDQKNSGADDCADHHGRRLPRPEATDEGRVFRRLRGGSVRGHWGMR